MSRVVHALQGLPGIVTSAEVAQSGEFLATLQVPSGQIPWFPGGHCDPWNHVESAMALTVTGHVDAARAAYDWLARTQLGDGSWFNYYLGAHVKDARLDTNVSAYVATGLCHYLWATGDVDFVAARFAMVERAMEFVLRHQRPDGTIAWSLDARGRREQYALLTGSSSIFHALRSAVAIAERLDSPRPSWELAAGRLGHALAHHPEAFAPKHEFAMDWYYPVFCGAVGGDAARARIDRHWDRFVLSGHGVRCVHTNEWVTAAETAECVLTLEAMGQRDRALSLIDSVGQHRRHDGAYLTGWVYPQRVTFPTDEVTSYTVAAVLLAVDALTDSTPAAGLFRHGALAPVIDWPEANCSLR